MSNSMHNARDEVLARVRRGIGPPFNRSTEYASLPRRYRQRGLLSREQVLETFLDRLRDYGCGVYRCSESDLPETIGHVLTERGKRSLLVPSGVSRQWLPPAFDFIRDPKMTNQELDRAEGVATGCAVAIAATGTIVLAHSSSAGSRALTLIPDYHLCIVLEQQVVETVPEGIEQMANFSMQPLTTVAGPSATADIEMTRVKGVHGPRTLDVILLSV
jgi:L-lactate dehydrogenase complex protein LldG